MKKFRASNPPGEAKVYVSEDTVRSFAKKAQDDRRLVIQNEVKNLIHHLLRSFTEEAQEDKGIS